MRPERLEVGRGFGELPEGLVIAPIPSLWISASLADANVVVVGDHKQLSPIVLSDSPLAAKWLGRDVFEVAGLTNDDASSAHLAKVRRQYRMHPRISDISNAPIYDGDLEDDERAESDGELAEWYEADQSHDHPVLLVDTGPLDAWVTSVVRGARSSRLNGDSRYSPGPAPGLLAPAPWPPGRSAARWAVATSSLLFLRCWPLAHRHQGDSGSSVFTTPSLYSSSIWSEV